MIRGAVNDKGERLEGQYSPQEFGQLTLWQMKHLFGYRGKVLPKTAKEMFWERCRIKGDSEFDIWRQWHDQFQAIIEAKK